MPSCDSRSRWGVDVCTISALLRASELLGESKIHDASAGGTPLRLHMQRQRSAPVEGVATSALPSYAPRLAAMHRAHAPELERLMKFLPFDAGQAHLDVASGDGTFAIHAARQGARVSALDQNEAFLHWGRHQADAHDLRIRWVCGDALAMPFENACFDSAFCAQSCYTLGDVNGLLTEMRRVVRPGGWCALLENDSLHHVLLPWPPALELKLREAELEALRATSNQAGVFYMARQLAESLQEAGFERTLQKTFTTERRAPLSSDEQVFLEGYLGELRARVENRLAPEDLRQLDAIVSGEREPALLERADLHVLVLDVLALGWAPAARPGAAPSRSRRVMAR